MLPSPGFHDRISIIMKKICILTIVATLAAPFGSVFAGDITGKITLKGTPPKEKDITPLKDDVNCGKFHSTMPTTKFYVVGAGGELADAVVYLTGVSGKSTGGSAAPALLDQKSCEYVPQIFAIQTGQKKGMQLLDDHMFKLWKMGLVEKRDILVKAAALDELSARIAQVERGMFEDEDEARERGERDEDEDGGHPPFHAIPPSDARAPHGRHSTGTQTGQFDRDRGQSYWRVSST